MQRFVNPYLFVARIVAILGMAFTLAIGILALVAAFWLVAIISFALTIPFFLLMRYVERSPEQKGRV